MLLDTKFHIIWCYFMAIIWMTHGWSEDVYIKVILSVKFKIYVWDDHF
jgi:hypothetical protein